jgi:hypothetical protein
MAAIDFPNSPTPGDTFTASDKTWVYLDGKWTLPSVDANGLVTSINSASSGQFLKWNGSAWVNDTIDLGADTTGNFVASLVAGTGVTLANNSGEAATPTVTVDTTIIAPLASPTFTGTVSGITKTMVGLGNVDNTSDANKPVSTAQQTALDLKANLASLTSHEADTTNIHGIVDTSVLVTTTGTQTLTNKTITSPSGLVKGDVGLGNVDNTSDANKPVSTAQQTALDLKANLASPTFTGTVTTNDLAVSGNLTVSGTTTSINTETVTIDDNIIVLNNNATGAPSVDAGIEIERGSSTNVSLRWNETTDKWQFTNDGSTYTDLGAGGASISDTAPASPVLGQIWFESDTAKTYVYYDSQWIEIGALAAAGIVTMSDTAPVSPADGKLWFDSSTAKTYVYYDSSWVEIGAGSNPAALNDIGDVTITSASNGQFLKWNGTAWVNDSIPTINTLDDVGDVTITSATSGQILQWNGTAWVNAVGFSNNKQAILGSQIFG